jgi:hypothetical protein
MNPLRKYVDEHTQGAGIWKWRHYFDIYDRHFARFRGQAVNVLEVGIYAGGSLEMWREYFGPKVELFGVDIEPACKASEKDGTRIFIGDQADPFFWAGVKLQVPKLDIVIDDGGHTPEQQRVTMDQLLPHLRRGGVYCCEDIHGFPNEFAAYVHRLAHRLNHSANIEEHADDNERSLAGAAIPFQSTINSIHLYPFMVMIEKNDVSVEEFVAPKRGDVWDHKPR